MYRRFVMEGLCDGFDLCNVKEKKELLSDSEERVSLVYLSC